MRNISDKIVQKIKTHILYSVTFLQNRVVNEICGKYCRIRALFINTTDEQLCISWINKKSFDTIDERCKHEDLMLNKQGYATSTRTLG
jgi:hypothetical protein